MKKILTLDDLYAYYSSTGESSHFSSNDEGCEVHIQVPGDIKFEKDNKDDGLTPVTLKACHTGINLNKSKISDETMVSALPSFSNRPILAYIYHNEVTGEDEFYSHIFHEDEDGNVQYDEIPVGILPESCNAHLEYDEKHNRNYVIADGYIFDEYSKAKNILARNHKCSCSVELSVKQMSYNAKEKVLNIEDFILSGVTLLGKKPDGSDVKPGMEGSEITLADFSESAFNEQKILNRLDELEKKFSNFSINNIQGKEEDSTMDDLQNTVTEEQTQVFEDTQVEETHVEESLAEESHAEEIAQEDFSKIFNLSHEDIRVALYNLLGQYEETDNEWYAITNVYDDNFVYQGLFGSKIWGQKYAKDGDNVALDGERWELFAEFLTESEKASLESMRNNYAEMQEKFEDISSKLAKYEAEPKKMELLESADYKFVENTEDFENLKKVENHFDLSFDEVKSKADEILLSFAKNGTLVAPESEQVVARKNFVSDKKKAGRYGNMFSK